MMGAGVVDACIPRSRMASSLRLTFKCNYSLLQGIWGPTKVLMERVLQGSYFSPLRLT